MPTVHIVFGPQGAGKSTYAKRLAAKVNGVRFGIDDWMWRLYGEDMPKSLNLKWIMTRVERCEAQIWQTARALADTGTDVVLDLGFTKRAKRIHFLDLAAEHGWATQLHYLTAPHALRRERVLQRNVEQGSTYAFQVTGGMFDFMEGEFHSATDTELATATVVDTGGA